MRQTLLGSVLASIIACLATSTAAAMQPEIDTTSDWEVGGQTLTTAGAVTLSDLRKIIDYGDGTLESEACFGEVTVPGIVIGGASYNFSQVVSQDQTETSEYRELSGTYRVDLGGGQTLDVNLAFRFHRDGKFVVTATAASPTPVTVAVPVYFDYDFHGPGHDVFEFAWNVASSANAGAGSVVDPAVGSEALTYTPPTSVSLETVDYYTTLPHEVAVSYAGLYQASNPASIEYTQLARVYDQYSKLGAVIWPWSDTGVPTTDYTLVFHEAADGPSIAPDVSSLDLLQDTAVASENLSRYPYEGSDQAVTVFLNGDIGGGNSVQVAGKLFQKSPLRELLIRVHYWEDMYPWVPAGSPTPAPFTFDPDRVISGGATFRDAFAAVAGDAEVVDIQTIAHPATTPDDFSASMANLRDFSTTSQENVEQWMVDLFIYPGSGGAQGMMPDILGGSNNIEREGAYVQWNVIRDVAETDGLDVNWQLDQAVYASLHELGHAFGLPHEWGNDTIMTPKFNYIEAGLTVEFSSSSDNWIGEMPETWVKPGRYGIMMGGYVWAQDTIDPLYQPLAVAPQLGDVNFDGEVTIVDSLLIAQHYVGLDTPDEFYLEVSDVNCDGQSDIVDSLLIAQYYVNTITEFPCGGL